MQIVSHDEVAGNDIEFNDLIAYLSEVVLSRTDEEIERHKTLAKDAQREYKNLAKEIGVKKNHLLGLNREKAKFLALSRVLSLIDTLNREGKLIGKKRDQIASLLHKIQNYDFSKLRELEESLSVHLPETYTSSR